MKTLLVLIFLATMNSWAGHDRGGGGDLCENRIQNIRNDLKDWIDKGGHKDLILPQPHTVTSYAKDMLQEISLAKISCVGEGDRGYPVEINRTPKVCRFQKSENESRIICDTKKFHDLNESDQYVLVHHEYAGLAAVEVPNEDDSDYFVSNQISGYLQNQVVKKLVVKSSPREDSDGWEMLFGQQARDVSIEVLKSLDATQFSDCKILVEDLVRTYAVIVRKEKTNSDYSGFEMNPLTFYIDPKGYPVNIDDYRLNEDKHTLLHSTLGQPVLRNEFRGKRMFSPWNEPAKLQVSYTTDPKYKKITKVSFYGVSFRVVNVGSIVDPIYEEQSFVQINFSCNAQN